MNNRFPLDSIANKLYDEIRNGNEKAIARLEGYDEKFLMKAKALRELKDWWLEEGKQNYLDEQQKIDIVERNREIIEQQIQEKMYAVL